MRAIVCTEYGRPEVLQLRQLDKPTPRDREVLIRIVATTVHIGDVRIRTFDVPRGQRLVARLVLGIRRPRHPILGMEVAGVIEALGSGVTRFSTGERVFAFTGWGFGGYAEYICLPERPRKSGEKEGLVALKPTTMSFDQAAAGLATGAVVALKVLRAANIRPGQDVLIYGASGSVGTYAVQLATEFGARVTGVSSTANLELVASLGADTVIDYTKNAGLPDAQSYDVIFDAVDKLPRAQTRWTLKPTGVYLNIVKDSGSGRGATPEDLGFLRHLVEEGRLRAVIDRTYPLEQIVEAHRYVEKGHKRGHVVIAVAPEGLGA
jgi:NADPH:quinone reductase-like Zn-dependent oxidoreductase